MPHNEAAAGSYATPPADLPEHSGHVIRQEVGELILLQVVDKVTCSVATAV